MASSTEARERLARRDPEDWPMLAAALALGCPIWTEDTDFFGCGVATWTSDRVQRQDFLHKLRELEDCRCVPSNIARSLHGVRIAGNKAAHTWETVTATEAKNALDLLLRRLSSLATGSDSMPAEPGAAHRKRDRLPTGGAGSYQARG
jgi:hypothetical protein